MDQLTIKVGPDFALGLQALACLDKTTSPTPDASAVAHELLRTTLIARLDAAGLPWAPSAEQAAARRAGSAGLPIPARVRSAWADTRARTMVRGALVVAALVALTGGYVGGWHWTGFRDNKQLWDWLQLLLLPVAFATLPLWLRRSQYMSRARRATYAAILVAFGVFVLIGYEMPLGWTGFTGNKLWDWLTLVLLPVALVTVRTWRSTTRTIRPWHVVAMGLIAAGWILTLIGGYAWNWTWTGYQGNTLWDWLQLALLPIIVPTVLVPALAGYVSGNVETRVQAEWDRVSKGGEAVPSA